MARRALQPTRLGRARLREHALAAGTLLLAVAGLAHVATSDDEPPGARAGREPLALVTGPALRPPGRVADAAPADAPGADPASGAPGRPAGDAPWSPGELIDARVHGPEAGVDDDAGDGDDDGDGATRGGRGRRGLGGAGPGSGDVAAVPSGAAPATRTAADEAAQPLPEGSGLTADLYDLDASLAVVPRVSGLRPTLTRLDPVVDFPDDASFGLPFEPETFVAAWTGYVNVERPGVHVFRVGSDDGARLEVDNRVLLDGDGLHAYAELDGELELDAGLHLVRLTYFENHGDAACRLLWAPPGASSFEVVPRRLLYPVDTARLQDLPVIQELSVTHAAVGQPVEVVGRGFSAAAEVRFGDALAPLLAASPERLLVVVPPGTDGGPLVVTVGGIASPGVEFTVDGLSGLHGRFVRAGVGIDRLEPLRAGPADFETLSGLDLSGDLGLPHPAGAGAPEGLRAEWRGRLWIHRGGWHRFVLVCDDGGRLTLDGEVVVEHDGLHAATGKAGEALLAEGPHDIVIEYFQNEGGATLRLEVEAPGPGGRPTGRRVVPRGWLEPPATLLGRQTPVIAALEPPSVAPGQRLVIRGEALADPLAGPTRVTLGGVELPVVSPGWASVVVEVPLGVDSGDLVVRAGPLASAPVPLEVAGFGWAATFVDFDAPADRLPDLDALAAAAPERRVARTDPTIDFGEDEAFGLAAPDTFVARWRGLYEVAEAGLHRFVLGSDDGARLTVAGRRLLDDDGVHAYSERTVEVWLPAGPAAIELDYFENLGGAACRLLVAPPGQEPEVIPRLRVRPDPR